MLTFARVLQVLPVLIWAVMYWDPTMGMTRDGLIRSQAARAGENIVAFGQRRQWVLVVSCASVLLLGILLEYITKPFSFQALLLTLVPASVVLGLSAYQRRTVDLQLTRLWAEMLAAAGAGGKVPEDHPAWVQFAGQVKKMHSIGRASFIFAMLVFIATFQRFQ